MDDSSADPGRDGRVPIQEEFLTKAKEAAIDGDPSAMVEYLYASSAVDGLVRKIRKKWPYLNLDDSHDVVIDAITALYDNIMRGVKVREIMGFLWKVSNIRAYTINENQKILTHPETQEQIEEPTGAYEAEIDQEFSEKIREERRKKAFSITKQLLSRLGQKNIQSVMTYIIDALEAGRYDVSNEEIGEALGLDEGSVRTSRSRGFRRLERITQEEGLGEEAWKEINLALQEDETEDLVNQ
jgi:DNA-directed RNA polymerase specialized sigma24 family protein